MWWLPDEFAGAGLFESPAWGLFGLVTAAAGRDETIVMYHEDNDKGQVRR
jgi:hypothetical protein